MKIIKRNGQKIIIGNHKTIIHNVSGHNICGSINGNNVQIGDEVIVIDGDSCEGQTIYIDGSYHEDRREGTTPKQRLYFRHKEGIDVRLKCSLRREINEVIYTHFDRLDRDQIFNCFNKANKEFFLVLQCPYNLVTPLINALFSSQKSISENVSLGKIEDA